MNKSLIFFAAVSFPLGSLTAQTVPLFINYQGKVTAGNGVPVGSTGTAPNFTAAPENRKIIFRIFDAATGGNRLWSEQQTVTVSLGEFSVLLGQGGAAVYNSVTESRPALDTVFTGGGVVLPAGPVRYLEMIVDNGDGTLAPPNDMPVSPRQRITTSAYSFRSRGADTVAAGAIDGTALGAGAVTAVKILDSAVTTEKIADLSVGTADLANSSVTAAKLDAAVGVWTQSGGNVFRTTGNVGIGNATPAAPLSFGTAIGQKISLYPSGTNAYGMGIQNATLQIHTDQQASNIVFGYGSSANLTETMRFTGTGRLGIKKVPAVELDVAGSIAATGSIATTGALSAGTVTATGAITGAGLNINGSIKARGGPPGTLNANNNGFVFTGNGGDNDSGMFSSADGQLEFQTNAIERVRILSNGNVGIGTSTPAVRLDVAGMTNLTMDDNGYSSNTNVEATPGTHTATGVLSVNGLGIEVYGMSGAGDFPFDHRFVAPVSIRSEGWIASARGITIYSDQRIKRDIQKSAPADDLKVIEQLQVTNYRMVDPSNGGKVWRKGFIAQEVEKVIPEAVSRSVEFVPDIFAAAASSEYDAAGKTLKVTLTKDHGLKTGGCVRLHVDGSRLDLKVSAVPSAREFVVSECDRAPQKVFVYGQQVNDFRTVDYERIFTTCVGALQELKKENEVKTKALEDENATLRQRLAALEQGEKERNVRLAAIEEMLRGEAKSAVARTVSLNSGK